MLKFSALLKKLRLERKLTQKALANALELDQSSISHYESNRKLPDVDTMMKMAAFFDVPVQDLLDSRNFTAHGIIPEKYIIENREDSIRTRSKDRPAESRTEETFAHYETPEKEESPERRFNEEQLRSIKWELDGQVVTPEEIEEAIRYLKFQRMNRQDKK